MGFGLFANGDDLAVEAVRQVDVAKVFAAQLTDGHLPDDHIWIKGQPIDDAGNMDSVGQLLRGDMLRDNHFVGSDFAQQGGMIVVDGFHPYVGHLHLLQVHGGHGAGGDGVSHADQGMGDLAEADLLQGLLVGNIGLVDLMKQFLGALHIGGVGIDPDHLVIQLQEQGPHFVSEFSQSDDTYLRFGSHSTLSLSADHDTLFRKAVVRGLLHALQGRNQDEGPQAADEHQRNDDPFARVR